MKGFNTVYQYELNKFFKAKSYVIMTIVLMVGVMAFTFFPRIKSAVVKEGVQKAEQETVWVSVPRTAASGWEHYSEAITRESFSAAFPLDRVELVDMGEEEIQQGIQDGDVSCAFVLDSPTSYTYYAENAGLYDSNTQAADEALREAHARNYLREAGFSAEETKGVLDTGITHEVKVLGKNHRENFLYTYIMIMALYMVILYYGQGVATSVASEKSSRAMELLITSVKPAPMIFGKILSYCTAGLVQLVCVFGTALLSYRINAAYWGDNYVIRSLFNVPPSLLGYMVLFFLFGFLIFAFLYGAVGSTVTKLEEVAQAIMPVTWIFIIGFFVTVYAITSGALDSLFVKVFSFIPFTSPMVMFARIAMSSVSAAEIAATIVILAVSVVVTGMLSAKIYRAGILIYGTRPKLPALVRTVLRAK